MNKESLINEEQLQNLYKLMESKDYQTIYEIYGKDIYNYVTPKNQKRKDIKKLVENKRHSAIYDKYGKVSTIKVRDLRKKAKKNKYSLKKSNNKAAESLKGKIALMTLVPTTIMCLVGGVCVYNQKNQQSPFSKSEQEVTYTSFNNNGKPNDFEIFGEIVEDAVDSINEYAEIRKQQNPDTNALKETLELGKIHIHNQITEFGNEFLFLNEQIEYEKGIKAYAEEIKSLNLSDLQTIMKVIDDTWETIDGYGAPKKDIYGLWRLDITDAGIAKCRNLADDFSAIMNNINPKYNARNLMVYQDGSYYTDNSFANVERNVVDGSKRDTSINQFSEYEIESNYNLEPYLGNHMVSMIEIPEEKITLVVDPLNLSIGVLKDGKINMFSTIGGKGLENKDLGNFIYTPLNDQFRTFISKFSSYKSEIDLEKLQKEYGNQAQNAALNYVRSVGRSVTR